MRISDWSSDVCSSDLLGRLDTDRALYLDKISGRRRVEISSRVRDRHPLTSTGLGKALLLDLAPAHWRHLFEDDQARGAPAADYATWDRRMRRYVAAGCAFDLDRKSVVEGTSVYVRVDRGVRSHIKKKNIKPNSNY